jgi:hypothetical protein
VLSCVEVVWPKQNSQQTFRLCWRHVEKGEAFWAYRSVDSASTWRRTGQDCLRTLAAFIITLNASAFIRPAVPGVESSSGEEGVHDDLQSKVE